MERRKGPSQKRKDSRPRGSLGVPTIVEPKASNIVEPKARTLKELREMARQRGIHGRHRMGHKELIQALGLSPAPAPAGAPEPVTVPPAAHAPPSLRAFGETRLVLMPVSPYWMHAYWELTPENRAAAERRLGRSGALVLRVYEVTGDEAREAFDIEVSPDLGNWYFRVDPPGRALRAALGLRDVEGRFAPAIHSNAAQTPSPGSQEEGPVQWLRVSGGEAPVPVGPPRPADAALRAEVERELRQAGETAPSSVSSWAGVPSEPDRRRLDTP